MLKNQKLLNLQTSNTLPIYLYILYIVIFLLCYDVTGPAMITKITPNERTVTVKQDSSLILECIAQGYPTPSIKWFKNVSVFL